MRAKLSQSDKKPYSAIGGNAEPARATAYPGTTTWCQCPGRRTTSTLRERLADERSDLHRVELDGVQHLPVGQRAGALLEVEPGKSEGLRDLRDLRGDGIGGADEERSV